LLVSVAEAVERNPGMSMAGLANQLLPLDETTVQDLLAQLCSEGVVEVAGETIPAPPAAPGLLSHPPDQCSAIWPRA